MKLLKSAAFLIAVLLKILGSQLLFLIRKMKINPISFSTFFYKKKQIPTEFFKEVRRILKNQLIFRLIPIQNSIMYRSE